MKDIFISWSTPDAAVVKAVKERLEQSRYSFYEYSEDGTAGSIADNVLRYVADSRIALIFLSAASVNAEWINTEVDWCYQQWRNARTPIIVPIILGDVPAANLPHLIQREPLLRRVQVHGGALSEGDLQLIDRTVSDTLAKPQPTVIPIALLAMNRDQAAAFLGDGTNLNALLPLCSAAGMHVGDAPAAQAQQELRDSLLARYGPQAEDFSPFPGATLKSIVEDVVGLANEMRHENGLPRLWLHWCTGELFGPDVRMRGPIRQRWGAGASILVLDSISSLHPEIRGRMAGLPQPHHLASSALLWVPPYTRHTAALTSLMEQTLEQLAELQTLDRFNAWGSSDPLQFRKDLYQPHITFDIGTAPTLRRWLFAAFSTLQSEKMPVPGATDSLAAAHPARMNPQAFNTIQVFPGQP